MSLKPRQSVLDLFDPLLSDALRVPLPGTPPLPPTYFEDEVHQENLTPVDSMGLLNGFSRTKQTLSSRMQGSGLLINIEEESIEIDEMEPVPIEEQAPPGPTVPYQLDHVENSQNVSCEVVIPSLVLPDSLAESPALMPQPSPPEPNQATSETMADYLHPPFASHNRRRSSIDISRTLSSFSSSLSSLLELPGSNVDLIKEELSPLSAFLEEDSLNGLEIEPSSLPAQEGRDVITPVKPNLLSLVSTEFESKYKATRELTIPKTKDLSSQQEYSPPSPESVNRVIPSYLNDTSNCQLHNLKDSKMLSKKTICGADIVSAPKRSKIFTLNRQHTFKPIINPAKSESAKKATSTFLHRPMIPLEGKQPVRAIPRLYRPAVESKIPNRVITQSENTNQSQLGAMTKTYAGASRIAVPLKKGVPKTASGNSNSLYLK